MCLELLCIILFPINGNLHWRGAIGYGRRRKIRDIIISFCLRAEVCRHIDLPEIELDGKNWYPFVREESLAIVIRSGDTRTFTFTFTIWVMKEYGFKKTWTQQLSVGPISAQRFVGCGRNGDLLLALSSRMFHLQQEPPHNNSGARVMGDDFIPQVEVVNHIESLVPIEGTKVQVQRELKKSWLGEDFITLFVRIILLVVFLASPFAVDYFIHRRIPTSASQ